MAKRNVSNVIIIGAQLSWPSWRLAAKSGWLKS
jgi:hypothetical protein